MLASRRMAQLAQRLGFDLADPLAGHIELLADFLEGVVGVHVDAEAHASTLASRAVRPARTSRVDSLRLSLVAISIGDCMVESSDEIAQVRIFVVTDRGFHGDRLFGDLQYLRILSSGMSMRSPSSSGVGSRPISWSIWRESAVELVDRLDHVHRMRMVRAWSAIERVIAWRIHQVA